jgi:hypothetical protein
VDKIVASGDLLRVLVGEAAKSIEPLARFG